MNHERENYLTNIYLILVNDRKYYTKFIDLFETAYENKPKFHHLFTRWSVLTNSILDNYNEEIQNLNYQEQEKMFTQHLSRYSDEILGKYVTADSIKKLIQDKFIFKSKSNITESDTLPDELVKDRRIIRRIGKSTDRVTKNKNYVLTLDNMIKDNNGKNLKPTIITGYWEYVKNINNSGTQTGRFKSSKINFKQKEKTMDTKDIIKTIIYVFDEPADDMSEDELFVAVDEVNTEINKFEKMTPKPNKLTKRIKELVEQRDALITYIDDRDD